MTCKDCVHYEVCNKFGDEVLENFDICVDFKDKAKFIDLPCKVGDKVWVLTNKDGFKFKGKEVIECEISNMRFKQDGETILYSCRGRYESGYFYSGNFVFNSIGKTVFLTKEKAEKALEEL